MSITELQAWENYSIAGIRFINQSNLKNTDSITYCYIKDRLVEIARYCDKMLEELDP